MQYRVVLWLSQLSFRKHARTYKIILPQAAKLYKTLLWFLVFSSRISLDEQEQFWVFSFGSIYTNSVRVKCRLSRFYSSAFIWWRDDSYILHVFRGGLSKRDFSEWGFHASFVWKVQVPSFHRWEDSCLSILKCPRWGSSLFLQHYRPFLLRWSQNINQHRSSYKYWWSHISVLEWPKSGVLPEAPRIFKKFFQTLAVLELLSHPTFYRNLWALL